MEFAVETLAKVHEELMPLLLDHKEEVCMFGKDIPLDPEWDTYWRLADLGILKILTARDNDKLVGYYIYLKHRHLHYNFIVADNDVLYLKLDYRSQAVSFFEYIRAHLHEAGIQFETISIKPHVDYRGLAEHLGYRLLEYKYFRRMY